MSIADGYGQAETNIVVANLADGAVEARLVRPRASRSSRRGHRRPGQRASGRNRGRPRRSRPAADAVRRLLGAAGGDEVRVPRRLVPDRRRRARRRGGLLHVRRSRRGRHHEQRPHVRPVRRRARARRPPGDRRDGGRRHPRPPARRPLRPRVRRAEERRRGLGAARGRAPPVRRADAARTSRSRARSSSSTSSRSSAGRSAGTNCASDRSHGRPLWEMPPTSEPEMEAPAPAPPPIDAEFSPRVDDARRAGAARSHSFPSHNPRSEPPPPVPEPAAASSPSRCLPRRYPRRRSAVAAGTRARNRDPVANRNPNRRCPSSRPFPFSSQNPNPRSCQSRWPSRNSKPRPNQSRTLSPSWSRSHTTSPRSSSTGGRVDGHLRSRWRRRSKTRRSRIQNRSPQSRRHSPWSRRSRSPSRRNRCTSRSPNLSPSRGAGTDRPTGARADVRARARSPEFTVVEPPAPMPDYVIDEPEGPPPVSCRIPSRSRSSVRCPTSSWSRAQRPSLLPMPVESALMPEEEEDLGPLPDFVIDPSLPPELRPAPPPTPVPEQPEAAVPPLKVPTSEKPEPTMSNRRGGLLPPDDGIPDPARRRR